MVNLFSTGSFDFLFISNLLYVYDVTKLCRQETEVIKNMRVLILVEVKRTIVKVAKLPL
jgi:hypothetical protein